MDIVEVPQAIAAAIPLSAPALRTFQNIADRWSLKTAERRALLGNIAPATYHRLARAPDRAELNSDTLERISHILAIYKALHVLFTSDEYADRWISEPNQAFGGESAKNRMLGSFTSLVQVRQYLDAERGW